MTRKSLGLAIAMGFAVFATAGTATAGPQGIWYDHTGRGAVKIWNCGSKLCGRVFWLKDSKNSAACGLKIIGNARRVSGGKWDHGWILDPDAGSRYSVEITPMGSRRLKVMGYAGSKYLNETMIWRRAPSNLKRCRRG